MCQKTGFEMFCFIKNQMIGKVQEKKIMSVSHTPSLQPYSRISLTCLYPQRELHVVMSHTDMLDTDDLSNLHCQLTQYLFTNNVISLK